MSFGRRLLRGGTELLAEWPFPTFLVTALLFGAALLGVMVLLPMQGTALEAFATDFRRWCFGQDDAGGLQWAYVVGMLTSPLWLAGFTVLVWWTPLAQTWRTARRRLWLAAAPAIVLVLGVAAGFALVAPPAEASLAFPARGLRTAVPAPAFELTDQDGGALRLEDLRGEVVVLTAIYSRCGGTCPLIMAQARRVLDALPEDIRRQVKVVAISLDPTRDSARDLGGMRARHGLVDPGVHLVTGEPARVEALLDRLDISRRVDPVTGEIDHANVFVLIDRSGRIAYRLSLGQPHEGWLVEALTLLVREPSPDAARDPSGGDTNG